MARINLVKAKNLITIGQRVAINLLHDDDDDDDGRSYASRVEDFNDKELVIAMPMDQGYPIIPIVGETVLVNFRREDGMYRFKTEFIDKAANPIPILRLVMPKEVERYQQREYVRVQTMIPLKVQEEDEEGKLLPIYHTHSSDISGGGIRLLSSSGFAIGTRLHIETGDLPKVGVLRACCKVVRVAKLEGERDLYSIGTRFVDLPKNIQQRLINFIFQKQRELLAKRLSD